MVALKDFSRLFLRGLEAASLASPTLQHFETRDIAALETRNAAKLEPCAAGAHLFVTRGHNAPEGSIGPLISLVNHVLDAIPNSTWLNTPYYTHVGELAFVITEIPNGTTILASNITSYAERCPATPIILIGYSEGAVITMNVLCGTSSVGFAPTDPIASTYNQNVIATVVYGDESRAAGQTYDEGTCETFGVLTRTNPSGCAAFAPHIQSYCDEEDLDCCVGGLNQSDHHVYFSEYNTIATAYIKERYLQYRANHKSG